ncbi:hypothetical protein XH98_33915 [Bradyrhizobium sp. CCBAU 51745]|nr:hypothetical protein [Bradyrhizobium sp. CCBAU 45384]MDA9444005.1 hypothetical protein [Bradyrhizobium sp. CCBAU 51745]
MARARHPNATRRLHTSPARAGPSCGPSALQAKNVRIMPETSRPGDNPPDTDDPSFTAPIFANLFTDEEGEGFS